METLRETIGFGLFCVCIFIEEEEDFGEKFVG